MLKGGYILIDCKGYNLLGAPTKIDGIYDSCVEALHLNKPVFAYNMYWGSTAEITPIAVMLTTADDHITATTSTLQLVIDEDDTVTVNNLIQ